MLRASSEQELVRHDLHEECDHRKGKEMSISKASADALTIKQLICIGALAVFSILLSVLVLFYPSATKTTSRGFPYEPLSPIAYAGSART